MRTASLALAALLAVLVPLSAHARVVSKTRQNSHTVQATWEYTEGDISTTMFLAANNDADNPFATLFVSRTNSATGDTLLMGAHDLTPGEFTFTVDESTSPGKNSPLATARIVAPAFTFVDENDVSYAASLDVTFTATGPVVTVKDKTKTKGEDGFKMKTRFRGKSRPATTSGTVLIGGLEFAPVPAATADIGYSDLVEVTIQTGNDAS